MQEQDTWIQVFRTSESLIPHGPTEWVSVKFSGCFKALKVDNTLGPPGRDVGASLKRN